MQSWQRCRAKLVKRTARTRPSVAQYLGRGCVDVDKAQLRRGTDDQWPLGNTSDAGDWQDMLSDVTLQVDTAVTPDMDGNIPDTGDLGRHDTPQINIFGMHRHAEVGEGSIAAGRWPPLTLAGCKCK